MTKTFSYDNKQLDVIKHRKAIKIKMYFADITAKERKR